MGFRDILQRWSSSSPTAHAPPRAPTGEEKVERALLIRRDRGGLGQEIVLDTITHLGRSSAVTDHAARPTPETLFDARLAVYIEPADRSCPFISRNHALIYPPDGEYADYTVLDLNSLNGTRIHGERIPINQRVPLTPGMTISFGEASFDYELVAYGESLHYGLMVGHHGGNLRGVMNDLEMLQGEFEKRRFTVEVLINKRATEQLVLSRLEVLKRYLTDDSIFLFYFAGHGHEDGTLRLSYDTLDGTLALKDLFAVLEDFRGQKLIILDGCHTAVEAGDLPPRSILVGSLGLAYEGKIDTMSQIHAFDGADQPPVMGFCSRAIYRFLKNHPERIDIDALVDYVRQDPRLGSKRQQVDHQGTTSIILPTQLIDLTRSVDLTDEE